MKLFYQEPKPDAGKICDIVSKAYKIQTPERINGYEGAFLFHIPDVYVSDRIAQRMAVNTTAADELKRMLNRFHKDDYGFVTEFERDCNIETRYLSFSSSWMIGRYSGEILSGVIFETLYDISICYYPEEDITDVVKKPFTKWCYERHIIGGSVKDYRTNQMVYKKS